MQHKTLYIFAFSFFLFLLSAVIRFQTVAKMRSYTRSVDHSSEIITSLEKLSNYFKSAQLYSPVYEKHVAASLFGLYKKEVDKVPDELLKLDSLIEDGTQRQQQLYEVTSLIYDHLPSLMTMNIVQMIDSQQGDQMGDMFRISNTINMMAEQEEKKLALRKQELENTVYWNNAFSTILVLVAAVTIVLTFLMNMGLNKKRKWLQGFLESVLNSSKNGIISFTPVHQDGEVIDFVIEYANKAVEDLLGIPTEKLVDKKASEFLKYMSQDTLAQYKEVVEKQEPVEYENHFNYKGVNRWLMVRLAPRKDGFTATFHNITALKASEQKLKESIQQLERSNKELEQYAYAASHDLQEPLRKIQTFSNYLWERQSDKLDESGQGYLKKILASSVRMSTLIKDILNFSGVNDGTGFVTTDLNIEMDNVLQDLELLIKQKDAVVEKSDLPIINAIPLQIRQLFYNLVNNALKFTADGRTPYVKIHCRQLAQNELYKFEDLDETITHFQIEIADNGIGFSNAHASKIFSLFKRLNSKDDFEGSGIGLALCLKVVQNHHGAIYAEGIEGEGASFYVILPQKQPVLSFENV